MRNSDGFTVHCDGIESKCVLKFTFAANNKMETMQNMATRIAMCDHRLRY